MTPSETEVAQALARILAHEEQEQLRAATELADAAGVERGEITQSIEERQAELLKIADAIADDSLEEWWLRTVGEQWLEDPDTAQEYLGMEAEEWDDRKESWAEQYRDRGFDGDTEELAAQHVQTKWNVSLEEFEREVVNWSKGTVVETHLTRRERDARRLVKTVAAEIGE